MSYSTPTHTYTHFIYTEMNFIFVELNFLNIIYFHYTFRIPFNLSLPEFESDKIRNTTTITISVQSTKTTNFTFINKHNTHIRYIPVSVPKFYESNTDLKITYRLHSLTMIMMMMTHNILLQQHIIPKNRTFAIIFFILILSV